MTVTRIGQRWLTHDQFLEQLRDLGEKLGYAVQFTHDSRHSPAGWPDLVLCKPPRLIVAELKTLRYRTVTAEQQAWLERLRACGVEAYVWFPSDIEAIEQVLLRGERR